MIRKLWKAAYASRYNMFAETIRSEKEAASMKCSRADVHCKIHSLPQLRFEDSQLTSFSGLVLIQELFSRLGLRKRLRRCFDHLTVSPIFGYPTLVLCLVVHLLLGYRQLRDLRYYADDPLVKRTLGLRRLPDVATVSRGLARADQDSVKHLREMVIARLVALTLSRVTLDFDGSVLGTSRFAEGTAVGFNRKKKGQRSYYPLFCTVAQTGQVLDVLHRSGNVHDSQGAKHFILHCIGAVRAALPGVAIEVRMDSAFFSDEIIGSLDAQGVEYTVSVPFERFTELKKQIERRRWWWPLGQGCAYFEASWKPKVWQTRHRFLFIFEPESNSTIKNRSNSTSSSPTNTATSSRSFSPISASALARHLPSTKAGAAKRGSSPSLNPTISSIMFPPVPGLVIRSICSRRSSPTTSAVNCR